MTPVSCLLVRFSLSYVIPNVASYIGSSGDQPGEPKAGRYTSQRVRRSTSSSGGKHLASRVQRQAGCFRVKLPG
jgi:hypothetical protein